MDGVCDGICDGVCDRVWLFGKDSFEECPLTEMERQEREEQEIEKRGGGL